MSRNRNQANISLLIPSRMVIRSNDRQSSVLSLRTRIGLERTPRKSGHRRKIPRKFLHSFPGVSESTRECGKE